jgi:hypothetical protein
MMLLCASWGAALRSELVNKLVLSSVMRSESGYVRRFCLRAFHHNIRWTSTDAGMAGDIWLTACSTKWCTNWWVCAEPPKGVSRLIVLGYRWFEHGVDQGRSPLFLSWHAKGHTFLWHRAWVTHWVYYLPHSHSQKGMFKVVCLRLQHQGLSRRMGLLILFP